MTMYSPLDNIQKAQELRDKIRLEECDLRESIEYDQATGTLPVDDADYQFLGILNDLLQKLNQYLKGQDRDNMPTTL